MTDTTICSPYVTGTQIITLTASNGSIQSPNYPRQYPANIHCVWRIIAPNGRKVKLTFTFIDIEYSSSCNDDYVELRNYWQYSVIGWRYCGLFPPAAKFSDEREMSIDFVSDASNSGKGFRAVFEAVDQDYNEPTSQSCKCREVHKYLPKTTTSLLLFLRNGGSRGNQIFLLGVLGGGLAQAPSEVWK